MSVKHDMTREERQKDKALREQAKKSQDEDASGNFRYVVRGLPWERQIRKIKVQQKEREERPQEGLPWKTVTRPSQL